MPRKPIDVPAAVALVVDMRAFFAEPESATRLLRASFTR
jgi:hypothetical protein